MEETNFLRHPHSIKQLAIEIKKLCNAHKQRMISDALLEDVVLYWAAYESQKLFKDGELNPTITLLVGKKRTRLLKKIIGKFPKEDL